MKVLGNSPIDFKYSLVYDKLNIKYNQIMHKTLIYKLLKPTQIDVSYYHLRYLNLVNLRIYLVMFIIPILLKLRGIKLIWTIHNIIDHKTEFQILNKILNLYIIVLSSKCVVLHKDIKRELPKLFHYKIFVSNFGPIQTEVIASNCIKDKKNINLLKSFIENKENEPILFSISTAKFNNAYKITKYSNSLLVYVDPYETFMEKIFKNNNVFYIPNEVGISFLKYINQLKYPIGLVGHNNKSVATSLYMFATMQVPVLTLDQVPNSTIVEEYGIGEVIKDNAMTDYFVQKIKLNYEKYQKHIKIFLEINNWDKAVDIHHNIFR